MSIEIKYYDIPDGAQEDMETTAQGQNNISAPAVLSVGSESKAYATLEPGVWVLDGTREIIPDSPEVAFWSQQATRADGRFEEAPLIELDFDNVYSATGMSIRFSPLTEQWCSEIRVTWFNANSIIDQGYFYPNSAEWVLGKTVESFNRIRLELIATNHPGHFAKIERIGIGQTITFGPEELKNVQLVTEVDPTLCELSADMMTFEVVDLQERNLIPQESQKVELIKDGITEAVHYVVEGDKEKGSKYKFSCQSIIGLLEGTYLGGIYQAASVRAVLEEILEGIPFELHERFEGATITGYLPITSQRNAIQQIAFAIGAIVTTAGSEPIKFNPIPTATTARFAAKDIFLGGKIQHNPRIAKVEVISHSYGKSDEMEALMQEEEIEGSNLLLTFAEPHHSYVMTGGTILSSGENWVRANVTGPATLTAKKYNHTTITHSKRNLKATLKEQGNVVSVKEATLVNQENAKKVVERLYEACLYEKTVLQEVAASGQNAGMIATAPTQWGTLVNGMICSMNSTYYKNSQIASLELKGIEAPAEASYARSGTMYSGETEVVI